MGKEPTEEGQVVGEDSLDPTKAVYQLGVLLMPSGKVEIIVPAEQNRMAPVLEIGILTRALLRLQEYARKAETEKASKVIAVRGNVRMPPGMQN